MGKRKAQWNEQNSKIAEELKRNVHERKERKKENFCHTLFYYISILYVAYIFLKNERIFLGPKLSHICHTHNVRYVLLRNINVIFLSIYA